MQFAPKDLEHAAELARRARLRRRPARGGDRRAAPPARRLRRRPHRGLDAAAYAGGPFRLDHEDRHHHPALRRRSARRLRAALPAASPNGSPHSTTSRCSPRARATTSPGRTSTPKGPTGFAASPSAASRTRRRGTSKRSTGTRTGSTTTRTRAPTRWSGSKQQGPWCPALIEYLRRHQQQYDVLVFFTYLYAPTVLGLEVNPGKSVLVSTAHDEPAIRLGIFKDVFATARRASAI